VNSYDADSPRQRLVEAAERLFAARGIDGVSLAEVTRAAGLGNTGAVHHYFGGRDQLVEAIVEHHRADLDTRRHQLLDEAEALGDTSLALLVRVLVEPMAAKLDDERGRAFLSIQAQRTLRPRQRRATPRPLAVRLLGLLGIAGAPGPTARQLDDFGRDLAYAALAQRAMAEAEGGREAGIGREEFVGQLCGAVARILTPAPAEPAATAERAETAEPAATAERARPARDEAR
jgi:AcrR family transcriptional regulator